MKKYKKTIGAAFGTIAVFIFSMPDKFIELYKEFMHSGLTPAFAVALAIWTSKEIRNKKLDRRDARWEMILNSIVIAVGAQEISKPMEAQNLRRFFLSSRKATIPNHRGNRAMKFLKSNISKKLLALLVGVGVTALNSRFNLQLSENEIYALFVIILGYIVGQSHVDGRKALASSITAVSEAVQASTTEVTPINSVPLSFNDLRPYINEVAATINKVSNDYKSKDINAIDQDAVNLIMSIHSFIKKGV